MTPDMFDAVRAAVAAAGFEDDVAWSENAQPPSSADAFALEAAFVICNSGMKNTVAQGIYTRVEDALRAGKSASTAFGHRGKTAAIDSIWSQRERLMREYALADDKIEFCAGLPWIGGITKYHLAKNFGADVAKPDVHLQRVADRCGESVQGLCERLGAAAGLKARTVDVVIWRACALGIIDSKSGRMRS